jgi:hypothetical protein
MEVCARPSHLEIRGIGTDIVDVGYHSTAPQPQSQWAPPAQNQASNQQWNQAHQQQGAGGYNPGTYGAMPGGQQVRLLQEECYCGLAC